MTRKRFRNLNVFCDHLHLRNLHNLDDRHMSKQEALELLTSSHLISTLLPHDKKTSRLLQLDHLESSSLCHKSIVIALDASTSTKIRNVL